MTEIIEKMDEWTDEHFQGTSPFEMKLWGHCELARRSSKGTESVGEAPIVMTINGTSDRQLVTLDDRYDFISWWRTPTPVNLQNTIDNNDWGFGFDSGRVQKITFRWVIAWKVGQGEMIALNLASELPTLLTIDGYQFVSIDKINTTIDHDDEGIYTTELGNTVYEKRRTTWNLAVINLVVEYILDPDCILPDASIPPESWPVLNSFNLGCVALEDSPGVWLSLFQMEGSWSIPTLTMDFVVFVAAPQLTDSPLPDEGQFIQLLSVSAVTGSYFADSDAVVLGSLYESNYGPLIDHVGEFVPYIVKFIDQYNRQTIVETGATAIATA